MTADDTGLRGWSVATSKSAAAIWIRLLNWHSHQLGKYRVDPISPLAPRVLRRPCRSEGSAAPGFYAVREAPFSALCTECAKRPSSQRFEMQPRAKRRTRILTS